MRNSLEDEKDKLDNIYWYDTLFSVAQVGVESAFDEKAIETLRSGVNTEFCTLKIA